MSQNNQHWQFDIADDNIVWLGLDRHDAESNTISAAVLTELSTLLDEISDNKSLVGLIIYSAKPAGIFGADVSQFEKINDANEAFELVRQGQTTFQKISELSIPTLAMIQGFCLGGGMEMALACDYRIAENSSGTRMGLPEVKLGIHPGWGGSVRLPHLVGPLSAMDLMLTGRTVVAAVAKKIGLVDAAVPLRQLRRAAQQTILTTPDKHKPKWWQRLLNYPPFNIAVVAMLRKKLAQKIKKNQYPAPFAMIDNWLRNNTMTDRAFLNEANSLSKLFVNDTARNLLRVFNLQEQLKKLAKQTDFSASHVHVIGAGTMGGDIAAWCALRGCTVTLQDREAKFIAPAIERAAKLFTKKLRKPYLIQAALDRLIPDPKGSGVPHADVIIEAVFEDLAVKQDLFKSVEELAKPTAILASNTSSIPLDEINTVMKMPERLVGLHFFNPVAMMPLVEIVIGEKTDTVVTQQAASFVRQIERLPLPVKSSPGFLVNRILLPYLLEAMLMVEEGVPMAAVDKAALDFGMPMGPVELADSVGLDVCLLVAENMSSHLKFKVPEQLDSMVKAGKLGRKSNQGFYQYKNRKPIKPGLPKDFKMSGDIVQRLIKRMQDEAAACLNEGIVENPDLLDAGMVFGAGFAPFRGGLMHYVNAKSE